MNQNPVTFKRDRSKAMAARISHEEERRAYAEFASHDSEEEYRRLLAELYPAWPRPLRQDH